MNPYDIAAKVFADNHALGYGPQDAAIIERYARSLLPEGWRASTSAIPYTVKEVMSADIMLRISPPGVEHAFDGFVFWRRAVAAVQALPKTQTGDSRMWRQGDNEAGSLAFNYATHGEAVWPFPTEGKEMPADMLDKLSAGVPIPLKNWLKAAGIDHTSLAENLMSDPKVQERLRKAAQSWQDGDDGQRHFTSYEDALAHVYHNGKSKEDRTGTGTRSVFGLQMRFDLQKGFPLVTTKKVFTKGIIHELLWLLSGDTNIHYLQDNGVHIWDEWANEDGELGPVYGAQWRSWPGQLEISANHSSQHDAAFQPVEFADGDAFVAEGLLRYKHIDQIANVMQSLRDKPYDRGHIVSAWNVADLGSMALRPCHALFQFDVTPMTLAERAAYVDELDERNTAAYKEANPDAMVSSGSILPFLSSNPAKAHERLDQLRAPRNKLSCQLYQRSADMFLGVPFNIASYAMLTHMIAQQLGYAVGDFVWTGGDCHIYNNHVEQVREQISRTPRPYPTLELNKAADIDSYTFDDFKIVGYDPHPAIKGDVAV